MNKDLFIQSIRDYTTISKDVAADILELKSGYPYCQLLHALAAKVTKDHNLDHQQDELQLAAVYAADRSVLKDVMNGNLSTYSPPLNQGDSLIKPSADTLATGKSDDTLAEEVVHDLERLHQLRQNFELLFQTPDQSQEFSTKNPASSELNQPAEIPVIEGEHEKPLSEQQQADSEKTVKQPRDLKARKERIVAIARALQAQEAEDEANGLKKKKSESGEGIIDEIVSTKEEISPENDKQKEQLNIIEQFIKTQPSISPNKDKVIPAPTGDLSTIKTGEFGDNVVSETLAEILVKQGKKEKAIEVYKKLIWKFPQKKTYFAAQIEELKK